MEFLESSGVLANLSLTGYEDEIGRRFKAAQHLMEQTGGVSLRPLLPLLLNLKGKPYTIENHFPFSPLFRSRMPRAWLIKAGRQVSKSTSLAALGVTFSSCHPYFSTLYITPLYEQIRRFSQSYVRPFIETSTLRRVFAGKGTMNSVLQRTLKNNAQMFFSFAYLDAERTRGIPADENVIDEIQLLDIAFLAVIHETMSGSPWKLRRYTGTPLTRENTIQRLWDDSSQAEWVIKCHHGGCNHWNIPALDYDLDDMIGPYRPDIGPNAPGLVCVKCAKPLRPRQGRWVHARPELRWEFAGYHIPQVIMPMHYANAEAWGALVGKRQGRGNTRINVFYNEVCGESYDAGSKLVTVADLKAAAVLPVKNDPEGRNARRFLEGRRYLAKILAADWGGGGLAPNGKELISFTCLAAMGIRYDGRIDVFWGLRSLTPHDHVREAGLCRTAMSRLGLSHLVHDYGGGGHGRETLIHQAGLPWEQIVPIQLGRTGIGTLLVTHEADEFHPRHFYVADKPRSLLLTCHQIRYGMIRFYEYDYQNSDDRGLLQDFMALVEMKIDTRLGGDLYTIVRTPESSDDFAQAVNLGALALYKMTNMWPNLAAVVRGELSPELSMLAHQDNPTWAGA